MYSHTYSDDFWRENDMNDILIGSDKFLTTGNSMMEGSPGGLDLNVSQNMFEANNNTHIFQTPVNKMTAQNMTTEGAYISPLNPFSKSMNVHSDNQQPLTVTTSTTNIGPIMSQAPPGVGFNPITQITGNDDENRLAGNRQLHAQGSEGDGTKGVCKVLDVGADDGHTMLKVSSQPHCENRRYGSPGVLHREKQQDMVPGYGYQFYGSADGPRLKDRYYGSPSVPQLGNQYYGSTYRPRYEIQHGRSHTIQMYGDQHYGGSDVPRWGNQHHGGPRMPQSGNQLYGIPRVPYADNQFHGSSRGPFVQPDKFDGSVGWQDYITHFELCAEINGWSDAQKATHLAVSLQGPARELLCDMPRDMRHSYGQLSQNLSARFGSQGRTDLFRTQLKSRVRRSGESLPELSQAITRLVSRAYPQATVELREIMAMDYFIDALQDGDIRLRLKQGKPTSISEAVNMAIELEAFQLAEKDRMRSRAKGYVRMSQVDDDYQTLKHKIACLEEQLKKMSTEKKDVKVTTKFQSQSTSRSRRKSIRCWRCNELGHYQSECQAEIKDTEAAKNPAHNDKQGNENRLN